MPQRNKYYYQKWREKRKFVLRWFEVNYPSLLKRAIADFENMSER